MSELDKLLRLTRLLISWGIGAFVAFWALAYTWLAFNH